MTRTDCFADLARDSTPARTARRVDIETRETSGSRAAASSSQGRSSAPPGRVPSGHLLVHASGAEDRESLLPFARFLVRQGMAVLGYDKRGVGGSRGDWNKASFDDSPESLAAVEYLKTRRESSAQDRAARLEPGWMGHAPGSGRSKDLAFLVSLSGAAIPPPKRDRSGRNEMAANGMRPEMIDQIVGFMKLQYQFLRTGQGWNE